MRKKCKQINQFIVHEMMRMVLDESKTNSIGKWESFYEF
jgi:hypothetical protein